MLMLGSAVDNRTICDIFGVANMGGIRVNKSRNLIVLISNNADATYRNEWRGDILHFVGMGTVGPQKLDRQNKTLANSQRNATTLHLFEVFEKSHYTYAGQVELADEPYMSEQRDARADDRFVWMFPLCRKADSQATETGGLTADAPSTKYLPHGAYAVIGSNLNDEQTELLHKALDGLKEIGIDVIDQRDIDIQRYQKALDAWHEAVLDRVRSAVQELIAKRKRQARKAGLEFTIIDDELRVNGASTEQELRAALAFLDRDDPVSMNEIFEDARGSVPMPDPPKSSQDQIEAGPLSADDIERPRARPSLRFEDFT